MRIAAWLWALTVVALLSCPARAAVVFAGPTGPMATNTSFSLSFNSAAATTGALSFTLNGSASLDGQNFYEDDFSLVLNGTNIFSGTFNLGGGSSTSQAVVFSNPFNASLANPTNNGTAVCFCGGQETFSFAGVPLIAGNNTLTFAYTSLGAGHAGFQGLADEGWGVQDVSVGSVSAVPELSTWAMMMLGFCGLGMLGRRLKGQAQLAASSAAK
jgi:hypothetical protein